MGGSVQPGDDSRDRRVRAVRVRISGVLRDQLHAFVSGEADAAQIKERCSSRKERDIFL